MYCQIKTTGCTGLWFYDVNKYNQIYCQSRQNLLSITIFFGTPVFKKVFPYEIFKL